jgi:hypothetical protein
VMKRERDAVNNGSGRGLVVLKDGTPCNPNGVADGLRSRRDRGRVAADQSRNSRDLSFTQPMESR